MKKQEILEEILTGVKYPFIGYVVDPEKLAAFLEKMMHPTKDKKVADDDVFYPKGYCEPVSDIECNHE